MKTDIFQEKITRKNSRKMSVKCMRQMVKIVCWHYVSLKW